MPISDCDVRDPRMKRTRQLLQSALRDLLQQKPFDEILVQDVTEAATVNRATFYDHYTDKFALFNAMIASDFHKFLDDRNIRFEGACSSALSSIILAVCDYLMQSHGQQDCTRQGSFSPLMDAAIMLAIRRILLEGLQKREGRSDTSPEILASTVSSAIFGASNEWFHTADRQPAERVVPSLVRLIFPLLDEDGAPAEGNESATKIAKRAKPGSSKQ